MKIEIQEWENSFYFNIEPESVAEAALLVRLALNALPRHGVDTSAYIDKTFVTSFTMDKKKRTTSQVRSA